MYVCAEPVMSMTAVESANAVAIPTTVFIWPWADARKRQHRAAGRPVVAVGKVDGRLLMHDLDRPDSIGVVEQDVGEVPTTVSGSARRVWYSLSDQVFDELSEHR
jgi:hypothetical protein